MKKYGAEEILQPLEIIFQKEILERAGIYLVIKMASVLLKTVNLKVEDLMK